MCVCVGGGIKLWITKWTINRGSLKNIFLDLVNFAITKKEGLAVMCQIQKRQVVKYLSLYFNGVTYKMAQTWQNHS